MRPDGVQAQGLWSQLCLASTEISSLRRAQTKFLCRDGLGPAYIVGIGAGRRPGRDPQGRRQLWTNRVDGRERSREGGWRAKGPLGGERLPIWPRQDFSVPLGTVLTRWG